VWKVVDKYLLYEYLHKSVSPEMSLYGIDLFWIVFTNLQFMNPLLYVCQNLFKDCMGTERGREIWDGANVV
jgi:hypothetical protein